MNTESEAPRRDYDITQSGSFTKGEFKINMSWKNMSLNDLETLHMLGKGSSGNVYLVSHKASGQFLALKYISVFDDQKRKTIINELQTLYTASSEFLIGFFGAFYQEGNIQIALEYMEGGSLSDIIKTVQGPIQEKFLARIIQQVCLGLKYLHKERHLVHRDLKPGNILFNTKGQFKISDFGVSAELDNTGAECGSFVGTVTYMRLEGKKYSFASDIWALGIIVLESVTGKFPFRDEQDEAIGVFWELLNTIKTKEPPSISTNMGYSKDVCDFIALCLQKDPKQRATVSDLLEHPFISKHCTHTPTSASEWQQYNNWINQLVKIRSQTEKSAQLDQNIKTQSLENKLKAMVL
ncbi:predicted protein [Naegleria gruberi]|uniref:mitogen-activated protein kinase kinase n=1 Tax=Naegleria gruberi TaxID=5762 RepID=D2VYL7_NAEGR|nr:uncharacterized protein NAEGRDRAFT_55909 [Naegleria gruberi]EFC38137.1 predicted protein [Naegleria gruberi]|eukprot:XP_002670881.1 predicted protein [Naegleria gruberi strain NEG-M]